MPGKPITIGPFTGGLNNISTSGEANDDELVQLVNFEIDKDTSLSSRPPMQIVAGSTLPSTNTLGWSILGIYMVSTTEWYLVVSVPTDGTTNVNTTVKAYLSGVIGVGETVINIKNSTGLNNRIVSMVQFKDTLYFNTGPDATDTGFSWKKGATLTTIAMPRGTVMISWKSRLWVSGVTKLAGDPIQYDRVYFSTINSSGPQPQTWGASDFFDVAPGEGGYNTCILASFNNLIIFKTDGTWRFSFPSNPAQGVVEKISGQVGAANANSAVEFENYIYVYDQGIVYELINSNYTQINRFVKFSESSFSVDSQAPDVDLSVVNRRLIVRYFNTLFVYTVDTKAWSQWFSYNGTPGRFWELPSESSNSSPRQFIAATEGTLQSVGPNQILDSAFIDEELKDKRAAGINVTASYIVVNGQNSMRVIKGSDGTVGRVYLNRTGSAGEYDIPVSPGQKFNLSASVSEMTGVGQVGFRVEYLCTDGTTVVQDADVTATGTFSSEHIAPDKAMLANMSAYLDSASDIVRLIFSTPNFNRKAADSPQSLLRLIDEYNFNANSVEYIECWMETKGYDYQASPAFKRLFYWGVDLKTPLDIYAEARPVSKRLPVTWAELENYTHDQLSAGTWGNPLSFLNRSTTIVDYTEAQEVISDNGRFFIKLKKSLRFRQISYYLKLKTYGNSQTGPAKIFSLVTMVTPKADVVDKVS